MFKYIPLSVIQISRDQKIVKKISFFDWEKSFRKKSHSSSNISSRKKLKTHLGIPLKNYKDYLEKWKKENL